MYNFGVYPIFTADTGLTPFIYDMENCDVLADAGRDLLGLLLAGVSTGVGRMVP